MKILSENNYITVIFNNFNRKDGFAEVSKNLAKYRSESNFVKPSK